MDSLGCSERPIMNRLFVAFVLVLAAAMPARAQQLKMHIQDGRVTLEASAVPARQILAEWARIGGTRIVGADKVTGAPLTLKLVNMPERQALDIILRNVAGFMAAPRQASATPGASTYDRIMILATSSAPAQVAGNAGRPNAVVPMNAPGGPTRRLPPRPPNLPPSQADDDTSVDEQAGNDEQADTGLPQQPVFTFPSPPGTVNGNQVFVPMPNGMPFGRPGQPGSVAPPVITLQPNPNGQPTVYNFVPNADVTPPATPTTVFGATGAPTPGMIQQAPTTTPPPQTQRPPKQ